MPIKLQNLSKWSLLPAGEALVLEGNMLRKIKVEFNTEVRTAFMAVEHGVEYFIGCVDGHDTIEFFADGTVTIAPAAEGDGAVWFWTPDGEEIWHGIEGQRLFVKPMTREVRNPQMDAVLARQAARYEKRFALQAEHNERLLTQLQEERAARDLAASEAEAEKLVEPSDGGEGSERDGEGA